MLILLHLLTLCIFISTYRIFVCLSLWHTNAYNCNIILVFRVKSHNCTEILHLGLNALFMLLIYTRTYIHNYVHIQNKRALF